MLPPAAAVSAEHTVGFRADPPVLSENHPARICAADLHEPLSNE